MTGEDETIEDIAASLLNGVMVFLLGAILPALLIWQTINHGAAWTISLDIDSLFDASQDVFLTFISLQFMWWGVRTVRKGVTALRRRPASPPSK